jgi:hypothetical protein
MSVICELSLKDAGLSPELSYVSHFFQDLVETGIFYVAIFEGQEGVIYNPDKVIGRENILEKISPQSGQYSGVIQVVASKGLEIFSDIKTQTLICR